MDKKTVAFAEIISHKYRNEIVVTYTDDSVEALFAYYPDELSFSADEFVGLTADEANDLCYERDHNYLRG